MFSEQIYKAGAERDATVEILFQRGVPGEPSATVPFSNTRLFLPQQRNAYDVMTVSLLVTTAQAGEFVERFWFTSAGEARLETIAAFGTPGEPGYRPEIPAVILTVLPVG